MRNLVTITGGFSSVVVSGSDNGGGFWVCVYMANSKFTNKHIVFLSLQTSKSQSTRVSPPVRIRTKRAALERWLRLP